MDLRRTVVAAGALSLVVAGGCRPVVVETTPAPAVQPAPPPPTADALPANSLLRLQLHQTIGTDQSRVGDRFTASVLDPIVAANGEIVVPAGAVVTGVVTGLQRSRQVGDPAAIRIDFERMSFVGRSYPFEAEVVEAQPQVTDPRILEGATIGAAAGAALGAIIGRGRLRDILVGGALGAGAGTIISLGFGDVQAELPAGSTMTVRTTQHIQLR